MPNLSAEGPEHAGSNGNEKSPRARGLLPLALEELQLSVEELRVADEEMRVQNDELTLSRVRLEAERQRYQDLFEFAPDGYLVTNIDGEILEANRAASRLLGISARFLRKRSLATLIAMPGLTEFQPRIKALTASGGGTAEEWPVLLRRRPSGTFHAAITAAFYPGLLDQPATLRWLIRDITDRRHAEDERAALAGAQAARAEAEEGGRRTSEILEIVTDLFISLDTEWRFVSLNASATRLVQASGKDPNTLIGQVLWDAFPSSRGTAFETQTKRVVLESRMAEYEAYLQELNCWLHVRVFPSDRGVSIYAEDITERKQAEAALTAAYERERRIAETLQGILLHTPPPDAFAGLTVESFYEAASEEAAVGGDFSDVFTYGEGNVALVIGDISGKGLGAATLIAEVKYALRAILREGPWLESAMARLNDFVCEAQHQGDFGSDNLVVLSLAVFDPGTGELHCVTAGGEPLLVLRADGTAEAIGTNGLLLGVHRNADYSASQAQLAPGDTLLMVTDGLTEVRRDGNFFGFESLQALAVQLLPGRTPRALGEDLIESARSWSGGAFQDDVCLLVARRSD